jgi:hypothetical protein
VQENEGVENKPSAKPPEPHHDTDIAVKFRSATTNIRRTTVTVDCESLKYNCLQIERGRSPYQL